MSMGSILPVSKQEKESLKEFFLYSLKKQSIWEILEPVCIVNSKAAVGDKYIYEFVWRTVFSSCSLSLAAFFFFFNAFR